MPHRSPDFHHVGHGSAAHVMTQAITQLPPLYTPQSPEDQTFVVPIHAESPGLLRLIGEQAPQKKFGVWQPSPAFLDTVHSNTAMSPAPGMVSSIAYGNPLWEIPDRQGKWRADYVFKDIALRSQLTVVLNQPGINFRQMYQEAILQQMHKRDKPGSHTPVPDETSMAQPWQMREAGRKVQQKLLAIGQPGWEALLRDAKYLVETGHIVDFGAVTNNIHYLEPTPQHPNGELRLIDTNPPTASRLAAQNREQETFIASYNASLDWILQHTLLNTGPVRMPPGPQPSIYDIVGDPRWRDYVDPLPETARLQHMIQSAAKKVGYPMNLQAFTNLYHTRQATPEPGVQPFNPSEENTGRYMLEETARRAQNIYAAHERR